MEIKRIKVNNAGQVFWVKDKDKIEYWMKIAKLSQQRKCSYHTKIIKVEK